MADRVLLLRGRRWSEAGLADDPVRSPVERAGCRPSRSDRAIRYRLAPKVAGGTDGERHRPNHRHAWPRPGAFGGVAEAPSSESGRSTDGGPGESDAPGRIWRYTRHPSGRAGAAGHSLMFANIALSAVTLVGAGRRPRN